MSDWFLLSDFSGLRLTGPDARAFAHSQFTVPFTTDTGPGWQACAWCNPKGRAVAVILANAHQDHVDLVLPASQAADFARMIRLYAIGRKVDFIAGLAASARFGPGPGPDQLLFDSDRAMQLDGPALSPDELCQDRWQLADFKAGVAWLSPITSARHLPQELGLEALGGLSYRKGCYPGQEIIARVHFLGRQKRRLSGVRVTGGGTLEHEHIESEDGEPVGEIILSREHAGGRIGLAVVGVDSAQRQPCRVGGAEACLLPPAELC